MARVCEIPDIIQGDVGWNVISFLAAGLSVIHEGGLVECGLPGFNEKKQLEITRLKQQVRAVMLTCNAFKNHVSAILAAAPFPVKHMYGMLESHLVDALVIKFNMPLDYLNHFEFTEDEVALSGFLILNCIGD